MTINRNELTLSLVGVEEGGETGCVEIPTNGTMIVSDPKLIGMDLRVRRVNNRVEVEIPFVGSKLMGNFNSETIINTSLDNVDENKPFPQMIGRAPKSLIDPFMTSDAIELWVGSEID